MKNSNQKSKSNVILSLSKDVIERPALAVMAGRSNLKIALLTLVMTSFLAVAPVAFAQQPAQAPAGGGGSATANQSQKPAPSVIPCPQNLPCIQPATQKMGGAAIREYILGGFGVKFLTGFLGLVAATSVIFIIVGGLQMHLAFGNDEAVGTAKKTLTWAIVGLVIAILSVAIVRIISSISL